MTSPDPLKPYTPTSNHIENLDELHQLLADLREAYDGDPEIAHSVEDALKSRILRLVVEGHPDAALFAAELVKVDDWDVSRWCA